MSLPDDFIYFFRTFLPFALMPPAGLLWVVIGGLVIARFRRRLGYGIAIFGFVSLYILSMPATCGLLLSGLEVGRPSRENVPPPGAIIVLGADGDRAPDISSKAEPGPLSIQRLAGAALLARQTNLPVLMTGGRVGRDQPAVAELMATSFADVFGLPVAWRETQSENTCENARFSAEILRKSGIQSAMVVTHAWHMRRALLSFRRVGYSVIAAPLHTDADRIDELSDFLPHTNAWVRSSYAIHEWIGFLAYRFGACPATKPAPAMNAPAVP
jgi:uncharacterized SAM-binding protein YcdF (DUF218 family)